MTHEEVQDVVASYAPQFMPAVSSHWPKGQEADKVANKLMGLARWWYDLDKLKAQRLSAAAVEIARRS